MSDPTAPLITTAAEPSARDRPTNPGTRDPLSAVRIARQRAGDLGRRLQRTPIDERLYDELAAFLITDAVAALAALSLPEDSWPPPVHALTVRPRSTRRSN